MGGSLSADFCADQDFAIFSDGRGQPYAIEDPAGHVVALLPSGLGGVVCTRTGRWEVRAEDHGSSWAVLARRLPDRAEVGGISEGWVPNVHKLWVQPGTQLHMTHNPFNGHWVVKNGHVALIQITSVERFAGRKLAAKGRSGPLGFIKVYDRPVRLEVLELAIVLALRMIQAQGAIPSTSGQSAGPY